MDWASVGGQLAQIGLPALGGLFGGPLGGAIGGIAGKAVAAALGVVQAGSNLAWGGPVVDVVVTVGFFGLLALLFFVKNEMPQSVFQLLSVMLGVLATAFSSIVQYWRGSSESSRQNGEAIRQVAASAVTPSPGAVAQTAIKAAAAKR
jgi:threonine synthase